MSKLIADFDILANQYWEVWGGPMNAQAYSRPDPIPFSPTPNYAPLLLAFLALLSLRGLMRWL